MRILMLCYEFPPLGGDGSRVVHGLSRELVREGHEVDLVTMGFRRLPEREKIHGINIYRVPCIRLREAICYPAEMLTYIAAAVPLVIRLQRERRYQINHTHFIYPDGLIAYWVKKKTGLPFVITAHGSDVPGYNPNRFVWLHKVLFPAWKKVTGAAGLISCPSKKLQSLVLNHASHLETVVIPNGMDVNKFRPTQEKQKSILLVSRMFERKGLQYFLKAVKGLDHDYEVNIVGDGPYLGALRELAKGANTKIRFWGWLENTSAELKKLYERSSIFVLSSESENFPIVLLEAMSAGMAIVTTKGTGCAEVVGDAGLLVPPKDANAIRDALIKLMTNADLMRELGAAARCRLEERFGWPSVAEKYVEIYGKYAKRS